MTDPLNNIDLPSGVPSWRSPGGEDNVNDYATFIEAKSQWNTDSGFCAGELPTWLYPFQASLVEWALSIGRAAIFADCGLGKTAMQLAWASEIARRENKPVLIVTPIAVGQQTVSEASKFGVTAERSRDGKFRGDCDVVVTNYQQLHKYDPSHFAGVVGDESSAIKDFKSATKSIVTEFMRTIRYRLLCTATAAPNDFWELGTSSEALGWMGFRDMITSFFKQEASKDHLGWGRTKYRFRGHAEEPFWSWVCSWARSLRMPSDLGFSDDGYVLPPLNEIETVVSTEKLRSGLLFAMSARDIREEREERRLSLDERCSRAAEIAAATAGPSVHWCELNEEGDALEKMIGGAVQVKGAMPDEQKEEFLQAFSAGQIKRLVTKPKIGAWGLNWQHCSDTTIFPSHSYEQYYQMVRRFYRFGQRNAVNVNVIVTEGERGIQQNLNRKKAQMETLFGRLVCHMSDALHMAKRDHFILTEEMPRWL